jgi:hypothetical protein
MSSIGHPCERQSWFDVNRVPGIPKDGRGCRIFDMGDAVETRVINDLKLRWKVSDEQAECMDFGGRFRGHIDGIVWAGDNGEPMLLEIKSANKDGFANMRSKGIGFRPQYHAQVVLYMHYMGLSSALFVVENKNDQELHMEIVPADPAKAERLKAKALSVLRSSWPPPATRGDCYFCDWRAGPCGRASRPEHLCMWCSHFASRFVFEERGTAIANDVCLLDCGAADRWTGTCEAFSFQIAPTL